MELRSSVRPLPIVMLETPMIAAIDLSAPWAAVIGAVVGGAAGVVGSAVASVMTARSQRAQSEADRVHDREQREANRAHDRSLRALELDHDLQRARAQYDHERHQRWVDQMVSSAAEFATAVGWMISRIRFLHVRDIETTLPSIDERTGFAQAALGRMTVLFGPSSDTVRSADGAYWRCTQAIAPLRRLTALETDDEREKDPVNAVIAAELTAANEHFHEFARAAAAASTGPNPPAAQP